MSATWTRTEIDEIAAQIDQLKCDDQRTFLSWQANNILYLLFKKKERGKEVYYISRNSDSPLAMSAHAQVFHAYEVSRAPQSSDFQAASCIVASDSSLLVKVAAVRTANQDYCNEPNIARPYYWTSAAYSFRSNDTEHVCFWMPRMPGQNLYYLLRDQSNTIFSSAAERINLICQLFDQLTLMHHETPSTGPGVLHRDVKSSNTIYAKPSLQATQIAAQAVKVPLPLGIAPRASIVDFGLAAQRENSHIDTHTAMPVNGLIGTPVYMAPEVYNKEHYETTDVFALVPDVMKILGATDPLRHRERFPDSHSDASVWEAYLKQPYNASEMLDRIGLPIAIKNLASSVILDFIKCMSDIDAKKRPSSVDCLHFFRGLALWITLESENPKPEDYEAQKNAYLGRLIAHAYGFRADSDDFCEALGRVAYSDGKKELQLSRDLSDILRLEKQRKPEDDFLVWQAWREAKRDYAVLKKTLGEDLYARCGVDLARRLSPVCLLQAYQEDPSLSAEIPLTFETLSDAHVALLDATVQLPESVNRENLLQVTSARLRAAQVGKDAANFLVPATSMKDSQDAKDFLRLCRAGSSDLAEQKIAFDSLWLKRSNSGIRDIFSEAFFRRLDPVLLVWILNTAFSIQDQDSERVKNMLRGILRTDKEYYVLLRLVKDAARYKAEIGLDYQTLLDSVISSVMQDLSSEPSIIPPLRLWKMFKDFLVHIELYYAAFQQDKRHEAYGLALYNKLLTVQFAPRDARTALLDLIRLAHVYQEILNRGGIDYYSKMLKPVLEQFCEKIESLDTDELLEMFKEIMLADSIWVCSLTPEEHANFLTKIVSRFEPERQWSVYCDLLQNASSHIQKMGGESHKKFSEALLGHLLKPLTDYLTVKASEVQQRGAWWHSGSFFGYRVGEKAAAAAWLIEVMSGTRALSDTNDYTYSHAVPKKGGAKNETAMETKTYAHQTLMKALRQGELAKIAAPLLAKAGQLPRQVGESSELAERTAALAAKSTSFKFTKE